MLYYTKGTISHMSEITSGTSTSGRDWARMTIMIDIPGYQGSITKLSFNVGTDRISDVTQFQVGDKVEIGWSIYAREYNGRWYNNVDLVNIKSQDEVVTPVNPQTPVTPQNPVNPQFVPKSVPLQRNPGMTPNAGDFNPADHKDDLPF